MTTTTMTTQEVLAEIDRYQAIQKQVSPRSQLWQDCSAGLAPLFAEMARRQSAGDHEAR